MRFLSIAIFIFALSGCSNDQTTRSTHFVTEHDARLISVARSVAIAEGFRLTNRIYQVSRYEDGWIVKVDEAPGYTGFGEPGIVVDGTFFVRFGPDERVRAIDTSWGSVKPTTRPTGEAVPTAGAESGSSSDRPAQPPRPGGPVEWATSEPRSRRAERYTMGGLGVLR
jgi:hypothetical protein